MLSDDAKKALRNAMADKKLANEISDLIETLESTIETQQTAIDDLIARVEVLETP